MTQILIFSLKAYIFSFLFINQTIIHEMDPDAYELLLKNTLFLVRNIVINEKFLSFLMAKNILLDDKKEEIQVQYLTL